MRYAWIVLAGCHSGSVSIDESDPPAPPSDPPSTGFQSGPWEDPATTPAPTDGALYEGAYVRILAPTAGEVVSIGRSYDFSAELYAADGAALDPVAVEWSASDAPDFSGADLAFSTDALGPGTHDLTVTADLPNGDRVSDTIGGVRVQSDIAGTYSGLFSVEGSVTQISIACIGTAVIVLDPLGQTGTGDGSCVVSILGASVPMNWTFDLDSSGPELTGSANVDLVGFLKYDLPMTDGAVDPAGDGLSLGYSANIPFVGDITATLDAPRISLDSD